MPIRWNANMTRTLIILTILCSLHMTLCQSWTPVIVKNVTQLGPQVTPDVTDVSRDGGYSVLINGNILWLYDDTECMDMEGNQLSFISNTAAYSDQPNQNVSTVKDFGVLMTGDDTYGRPQYAILSNTTVGTGGWVPFQQDELDFNEQMKSKERVAIWPGTSPTPISTTQAFIYAPLVYVDSKPQDPSKEYQARGMTLITITAPNSGPIATRQGDLVIPGTEVAFGGFATLLGLPPADPVENASLSPRDLYLFAMTDSGLQLARVGLNDLHNFAKYTYYDPQSLNFSDIRPGLNVSDATQIYLPGTFSSGSIFYSPYFCTFIMIYFNKMVDSTFYIRYLDLDHPLGSDATWVRGGKIGKGIQAEDAEALARYAWSVEQKLYVSPPGKGGFNYAGTAHPEFFNRQYFAQSLYPDGTSSQQRQNAWYGSKIISEADARTDGKHLMLSWTSQLQGGKDAGIYQIQLAKVEFDDIPTKPGVSPSSSGITSPWRTPAVSTASSTYSGKPYQPTSTAEPMIPKNHGQALGSFLRYDEHKSVNFWLVTSELGFLVGVIGAAAVLF